MFIQRRIQDAAVSMVSSSLATNNVTGWTVLDGFSTGSFNGSILCVQVVADKWVPMYPENNLGMGKCVLHVGTFAAKTNITATEFETVSDVVFNPFLSASAATSMSMFQPSLTIASMYDVGLDVQTAKDGWLATQDIELVAGRIS